MRQSTKLSAYVAIVTVIAAVAMVLAWDTRAALPGWWELGSFIVVAFLLDQSSTRLKVEALGSTSFVIHMAAGILFGGYWGAVVAAVSTALAMVAGKATLAKVVFNASQRALCVLAAVTAYVALGGGMPPAYLQVVGGVDSTILQRDLLLFFVFAGVYFAVNSLAVSGAVALNNNRAFRDVWHLNTRGVLGYDLGASAIALLIAWGYSWSAHAFGLGSYALFGAFIPIVVVRHIYGLYHQLQESGQELLQVMVKAIEARDPYTSGHSLRVSALSRTIALELGLSSKEVEDIETAALLHDVGKIHEEFAPLLRKEGRLTPEETALMQTHSTKSADLVGIISKFRGFIQESVRHHHERWDGQGYPTGLSGAHIPLGSRIILVSDTIDAMTTDRPYRKRLSLDVVVAELQKCRGTQFDPSVVEVVVSSVAVRRLISEAATPSDRFTISPTRSRRVSGPISSIWRAGRV
jgi:hypothetical protein